LIVKKIIILENFGFDIIIIEVFILGRGFIKKMLFARRGRGRGEDCKIQ
jgi:hypothetical protein